MIKVQLFTALLLLSIGAYAQSFSYEYDRDETIDAGLDVAVLNDVVLMLCQTQAASFDYAVQGLSLSGSELFTYFFETPDSNKFVDEIVPINDSLVMVIGAKGAVLENKLNYFSEVVSIVSGASISSNTYPLIDDLCSPLGSAIAGDRIYVSGWGQGLTSNAFNALLLCLDLDGNLEWFRVLDTTTTNSSRDVIAVEDTIVVLTHSWLDGASEPTPVIYKYSPSGSELAKVNFPEFEGMYPNSIHHSTYGNKFYLGGVRDGGLMVVEASRGLMVRDEIELSFAEAGEIRAITQPVDSILHLTGHAVNLADNSENYIIIRYNLEDGRPTKTMAYSNLGELNDGVAQILASATMEDGVTYLCGVTQQGFVSGGADGWLLAVDSTGSCDTASCWPWLLTNSIVTTPEEENCNIQVSYYDNVVVLDPANCIELIELYSVEGKCLLKGQPDPSGILETPAAGYTEPVFYFARCFDGSICSGRLALR